MNENVGNPVLVQLRAMRGDLGAMRGELAELRADVVRLRDDRKDGFAGVNGRVYGLTMMLRLLATPRHPIGEHVEPIEEARG